MSPRVRAKPRKRPTIGELREIVKRTVLALAAEDSQEAFRSLGRILECLGWLQNYTECTSTRMRNGICALVEVSERDDVDCAARQCVIESVRHLMRREPGTGATTIEVPPAPRAASKRARNA